jgi:hypothetical protein
LDDVDCCLRLLSPRVWWVPFYVVSSNNAHEPIQIKCPSHKYSGSKGRGTRNLSLSMHEWRAANFHSIIFSPGNPGVMNVCIIGNAAESKLSGPSGHINIRLTNHLPDEILGKARQCRMSTAQILLSTHTTSSLISFVTASRRVMLHISRWIINPWVRNLEHIKSSTSSNFLQASSTLPYHRSLSRNCEIRHSAVAGTKVRGSNEAPRRTKHHELAMEIEQELVDWIAKTAVNNMAANKLESLHTWYDEWILFWNVRRNRKIS